jgi:two-component sensor histidine kinase
MCSPIRRRNILSMPATTPGTATMDVPAIANSLKYGALSVETGKVKLVWTLGGDVASSREGAGVRAPAADQPAPYAQPSFSDSTPLELTWQEIGGPAPSPTTKPGVGTGLIQGLTRAELRGQTIMRYPPEGASHRFSFMLDRTD